MRTEDRGPRLPDIYLPQTSVSSAFALSLLSVSFKLADCSPIISHLVMCSSWEMQVIMAVFSIFVCTHESAHGCALWIISERRKRLNAWVDFSLQAGPGAFDRDKSLKMSKHTRNKHTRKSSLCRGPNVRFRTNAYLVMCINSADTQFSWGSLLCWKGNLFVCIIVITYDL